MAMPRACPGRRRFAGDARGTTAVEFALVAPLLFAILFGIITFGVQYATRIALTYAAAEGGRAAVAGLKDEERATLAYAAIHNALTAMSPLVDVGKATPLVTPVVDGTQERIAISIAYSDTRFAVMPFLPDLSSMAPVTVQYTVTDPSG
jgi:Flp pilus assembly protein TadG